MTPTRRDFFIGQALVALGDHKALEQRGLPWLAEHAVMLADLVMEIESLPHTWYPPDTSIKNKNVLVAFKESRLVKQAYRSWEREGHWFVPDEVGYVPFDKTIGWRPLPLYPQNLETK